MRTSLFLRLFLVVGLLALACNAPFISGAPVGGGGGGLTAISPAATLLTTGSYAETARALAEAIAELNRAQLLAIEHLRASPDAATVDADLLVVSAGAMTVAQLAEQLAASTAAQGSDTQIEKAAQPYVTAAQLGYMIVIETQNLREDYKSGGVSAEQVSDKIAEQGGMLWSADEFDPATVPQPFAESRVNPVTAPPASALPGEASSSIGKQIDESSGKTSSLAAWSASSGEARTVRVTVPAPRSLGGDALDPESLNQMRTPEGQADADVVRAAAGAKLASLGAAKNQGTGSAGYDLEMTVPETTAFQSEFGGRALPYYPDGSASATATADQGGPLVSNVRVQDGQPVVDPPFEITSDTPLVTLEITEAVPSTTGADTRGVALTVKWTSSLSTPFNLTCYAVGGQSASTEASGATGEVKLAVAFSRLRDNGVCHARLSTSAAQVGASQVIVLEADPAFVPTQPAGGGQPVPTASGGGEATPLPTVPAVVPTVEAPAGLGPPPGTSNWSIAFAAATISCAEDIEVPIQTQAVTMTADETGDTMSLSAEGGSMTLSRTGPGTYTGTYEEAVMNLTFTSPTHLEGDYSVSAEGCNIVWPTTLDRAD